MPLLDGYLDIHLRRILNLFLADAELLVYCTALLLYSTKYIKLSSWVAASSVIVMSRSGFPSSLLKKIPCQLCNCLIECIGWQACGTSLMHESWDF